MRTSVVAIGNFDGVHTGHQALLTRARELAGDDPVIVVTFWPHPLSVVAPDHAPKLLGTLLQRIELLRHYGADEVRVCQFTPEMSQWSPERFVETILLPLNPLAVVVGTNFTFGRKAEGTAETLRELGEDRFEVEMLKLTGKKGELTCSTLVREAVAAGDVALAAQHLGHPFRVTGVVIVGDQRGRTLGFPTANLVVDDGMAMPADGVYAGWLTQLDAPEPMPAAISVGTNPTFDGVERRVESYVLDRDDLELYGAQIAVDFVEMIRGQVRFAGVEDLVDQMNRDVEQTRRLLARARQPSWSMQSVHGSLQQLPSDRPRIRKSSHRIGTGAPRNEEER